MDARFTVPPADRDALTGALLAPLPRRLQPLQAELLFFDGQYLFHDLVDGQDRYKLLTSAALRAAFAGQPVDSGWLTPSVVRWGEGPQGAFAILWVAPAIQPVVLAFEDTTETVAVPLPGLVLAGRGPLYWIWATATATFDPTAPAYLPPVPNVYDSGAICWGANRPPLAGGTTLAAAWDLFLAAPFNAHLAPKRSRSFPNDCRGQLLFLAAQGGPTYPVADLLPCDATIAECVARWVLREVR